MELQGCVLGVRWSKFVRENHSVPISRVYYWTDSRTALAWIKGDPRNYRQFISFRIGEILENTMVSDWRWVPTKINPADEATKWGSGPYFDQESKWFSGPDFLRRSEVQWPRPDEPITTTTEEIRTSVLHHCSTEPVIDFTRFSTWNKLLRSTAYVMRFVCNTSKKSLKFHGHLQQEELLLAENVIIKLVQRETYPDEVAALQNKAPGENGQKAIGKRSSIYKLLPMMDDEGLLREQGRIGAATNVPYERLHPIILPRNHYVTELIVSRYHRLYRHGNHETVVNELRQLYNIPRMRMVVKRICKDYPICKIRNARPKVPPMAPLPVARLAHHERAFTYTGLDYFGPLSVKQGRSNVKRWFALFTCLTIRAVHLEIAYTLTTASCISCVRRFVGRRGPPVEIFTDNGTNFQGADRVLRSQISQGLSATFTDTKTKWNFNPPGAPHMGGAWERLVKSVKCAMEGAYSEGKLDDEGLQTLIVEVENMVNTRPLTYLPLESEEAEALTPNHFLLLSSNDTKLPRRDTAHQGRCGDGNDRHMLGNAWELIQHQLDVFWQRWLTEYLPVIRRQSKWFEVSEPLKEGDLVMVAEPTKRGGWERGRIAAILPHSDGHLRRAVVQIGSAKVTRPVTRLALLDVRCSEDLTDGRLHLGEDVPANLATWPTK
ncbi:uncharacterized protein LOC129757229 [Uranotaenia lowii]|uniref:uncharacterized protein LOC129757229 n=1 Tax=Uranotaenia lowii TaxID=190385 RepID=UPI002479CA69|nr:uncharacterized protein LOC129757229 [Uranotaenia lowii]XP_055610354.1 uncharacterized protein LOC129757229 [Uranotaenia lowii]